MNLSPREGAQVPRPIAGERTQSLTILLSAGELACLVAIAERVGATPETVAWSYLVGELHERTDPRRGVAPWRDLPDPPAAWGTPT